jgi:alkanesulfonate monooxygenase SsuD/methylene tetrahydromethanopterin reductase-like flavin-dependent oxidoreductase (luciferase family)
MRALWAPGTKAYAGEAVRLPETTCYPRPVSDIPIIVGGRGERTLQVAARRGDACNVPSDEASVVRAVEIVRRECNIAGRDPDTLAVTVLDLPVVGRDRDEVWARVEAQRGRVAAATYARTHHAGTYAEHRDRYDRLAELGVRTVFLALAQLRSADDVLALAPMLAR